MSVIHYKFKSSKDKETLTFDGLSISLQDLKNAILQKKNFSKLDRDKFDLQVCDAQTQQPFKNEDLIPKNASVIVARVPLERKARGPKTWNLTNIDFVAPTGSTRATREPVASEKTHKPTDLFKMDATEDEKIEMMKKQSFKTYDPTTYVTKTRLGQSNTGPVPRTYLCKICNKPGHWISNCPHKHDPAMQLPKPIRPSTGIPAMFMTPVSDPNTPGALITSSGILVVPNVNAEAYAAGKKEKPPFVKDDSPDSMDDEKTIPDELLCPICKDIVKEAVVIPCCGNSFCDECIRQALLNSDYRECPNCQQRNISPDNLVSNKFLRTAVNNFLNENSYMASKPATTTQKSAPPAVDQSVAQVKKEEQADSAPATTVPVSSSAASGHLASGQSNVGGQFNSGQSNAGQFSGGQNVEGNLSSGQNNAGQLSGGPGVGHNLAGGHTGGQVSTGQNIGSPFGGGQIVGGQVIAGQFVGGQMTGGQQNIAGMTTNISYSNTVGGGEPQVTHSFSAPDLLHSNTSRPMEMRTYPFPPGATILDHNGMIIRQVQPNQNIPGMGNLNRSINPGQPMPRGVVITRVTRPELLTNHIPFSGGVDMGFRPPVIQTGPPRSMPPPQHVLLGGGMQQNLGGGMQQNMGGSMQQNIGVGMQPNMGRGMQQQPHQIPPHMLPPELRALHPGLQSHGGPPGLSYTQNLLQLPPGYRGPLPPGFPGGVVGGGMPPGMNPPLGFPLNQPPVFAQQQPVPLTEKQFYEEQLRLKETGPGADGQLRADQKENISTPNKSKPTLSRSRSKSHRRSISRSPLSGKSYRSWGAKSGSRSRSRPHSGNWRRSRSKSGSYRRPRSGSRPNSARSRSRDIKRGVSPLPQKRLSLERGSLSRRRSASPRRSGSRRFSPLRHSPRRSLSRQRNRTRSFSPQQLGSPVRYKSPLKVNQPPYRRSPYHSPRSNRGASYGSNRCPGSPMTWRRSPYGGSPGRRSPGRYSPGRRSPGRFSSGRISPHRIRRSPYGSPRNLPKSPRKGSPYRSPYYSPRKRSPFISPRRRSPRRSPYRSPRPAARGSPYRGSPRQRSPYGAPRRQGYRSPYSPGRRYVSPRGRSSRSPFDRASPRRRYSSRSYSQRRRSRSQSWSRRPVNKQDWSAGPRSRSPIPSKRRSRSGSYDMKKYRNSSVERRGYNSRSPRPRSRGHSAGRGRSPAAQRKDYKVDSKPARPDMILDPRTVDPNSVDPRAMADYYKKCQEYFESFAEQRPGSSDRYKSSRRSNSRKPYRSPNKAEVADLKSRKRKLSPDDRHHRDELSRKKSDDVRGGKDKSSREARESGKDSDRYKGSFGKDERSKKFDDRSRNSVKNSNNNDTGVKSYSSKNTGEKNEDLVKHEIPVIDSSRGRLTSENSKGNSDQVEPSNRVSNTSEKVSRSDASGKDNSNSKWRKLDTNEKNNNNQSSGTKAPEVSDKKSNMSKIKTESGKISGRDKNVKQVKNDEKPNNKLLGKQNRQIPIKLLSTSVVPNKKPVAIVATVDKSRNSNRPAKDATHKSVLNLKPKAQVVEPQTTKNNPTVAEAKGASNLQPEATTAQVISDNNAGSTVSDGISSVVISQEITESIESVINSKPISETENSSENTLEQNKSEEVGLSAKVPEISKWERDSETEVFDRRNVVSKDKTKENHQDSEKEARREETKHTSREDERISKSSHKSSEKGKKEEAREKDSDKSSSYRKRDSETEVLDRRNVVSKDKTKENHKDSEKEVRREETKHTSREDERTSKASHKSSERGKKEDAREKDSDKSSSYRKRDSETEVLDRRNVVSKDKAKENHKDSEKEARREETKHTSRDDERISKSSHKSSEKGKKEDAREKDSDKSSSYRKTAIIDEEKFEPDYDEGSASEKEENNTVREEPVKRRRHSSTKTKESDDGDDGEGKHSKKKKKKHKKEHKKAKKSKKSKREDKEGDANN